MSREVVPLMDVMQQVVKGTSARDAHREAGGGPTDQSDHIPCRDLAKLHAVTKTCLEKNGHGEGIVTAISKSQPL